MIQFMLMFSLASVQSFIVQARKTRDLWVGSLLLSKLMEAAMAGIEKEQLVFPTKQVVEGTPDIPNKYVALFGSLEDAQQAAERSTAQIRTLWEHLARAVWDDVIGKDGDETTSDIWHRQTDFEHLFEIYWAIVPRAEKGESAQYGAWLEETESLFAARKRLRDFKAQDEPGEKSSISGEREVLRAQQGSNRDFWVKIAQKLSPRDINPDGEERLDAIDTIKRFAMNAQSAHTQALLPERPFPSTSSIATATFVESLLACDPQHEKFMKWREATSDRRILKPQKVIEEEIPYLYEHASEKWRWLLQRDGDLYFPAIFTPHRLEKDYGLIHPADMIQTGKAALRQLFELTDERHITRPTPYYAVMQMDGDNMGMLLSGTRDEKEHRTISEALSNFAREIAPELVEQQYPARLVYAGGDDVLAFAPLARDVTEANRNQPLNILELADALQSRYQEQLKGALPSPQTQQDEERIQKVTASMGIVIAHHYTSLSYVLRRAREAEKAAKDRYDRRALVVTILRRSGEQTRVGCRWRYSGLQNDAQQPIRLFSRFLRLFKDDLLSPKCVFTLLEEAPALVGRENQAVQESEVRRVLLRQLNLKQKTEEEKKSLQAEVKEQLAPYLVALAEKMDEDDYEQPDDGSQRVGLAVDLHATGRRYGLVEVFGWLLVMAFLARKDQEQE